VKLSLTGSWSILLQTVQGASRSVSVFILLTHTAHAILDTNSNTLSDLWEKQFNNQQLFPTTAGHLPDDDPDGDGWTNIREAAAGTNPFESNPPDGIVRPAILHFPATSSVDPNDGTVLSTPEAFSLTWPTLTGKQYTLSASPDLTQEGWITIGPPFIAAGGTNTTTVPVTQPDGSVPEKLFWRVAANDVDTDGDHLTNFEEHLLGTNPAAADSDFDGLSDHAETLAGLNPKHPDFDLDGILDGADATPFANNAIANPDGENLPASLTTKITGRWDLETINISNGIRTTPNTTTPSMPATLGGGIAADSSGMVSKATRMSGMNQYLKTDPSTITGKISFSISLWFRLEKNYLQNKLGNLNTVLFAYNDVLDSTPLFQLHAYKAISTMAPQKLVFSHYSNTALQPNIVADIPLSAPLDDGQWQHLTLTKQSGIIRIYRNAQQVISGGGHSGTWATGTNAYLCFGALAPANSIADTNFRGSMDRIRTWSSALSQTEVTRLYRQDIDRDGLWDITESGARYSDYQSALPYHPAPNDPNAPQPTQTGYARSPYLYSSTLDFDQDELHDLAEQAAGTRLTEPDTDGDTLTDGFEVAYTFNPLNAFSLGLTSPRDDLSDPDSDSLSTLTEYFNGSNPRNSNTDGDATDDTTEVAQGSDPANAADSGAAPTDPPYQVPFHINGDYTAWEATLKGKGPNDTRTRRFRMSGHNVPADETLELLRGNAYELTLRYIRSKPGESVPWYCWEASVNGDTSPIFIAGGEWIVDNRSGLLAEHTHSHGTNQIADKKVDFQPVEVILGHNNVAYKTDKEALGVSNYVTTDGLPQDSQFDDVVADLENFRLQARLPNSTTNSVQMKLEVRRGGSVVTTQIYTLDKKDGDLVRGRFLRLVTDTNDDAASGAGAASDPNNQTILVKLGDKIKVSYDIAAGSKVEQEIQVGRPLSEDGNEADKPWKHDIRKLRVIFHVFKNFGGSEPVKTKADIDLAVDVVNERFAQAGIILEPSFDMGADNAGKPLPQGPGIDYSNGFDAETVSGATSLTAEESALFAHKDADSNTIDVFYVEAFSTIAQSLVGPRGRSYPASFASGNSLYKNNVVCTAVAEVFTLPHELLHELLNRGHRSSEPNTALFKGGTDVTKAVGGTKRIGPYPDAANSGVGNDDTTILRVAAETLPQQ
jgi:hypothetical protein